jgi:hypothetical protein
VVDALKSGNVARFINHSPKEHNLLKQVSLFLFARAKGTGAGAG